MSGTREPGSPGEGDLPGEDDQFELPEDDFEDGGEEPPEPEEEALEHQPDPPPRQTRRERQAENWRERAIRAEAERDALRTYQPQQPQPQQPDSHAQQRQLEAEYERISMLPPEQQVRAMHGLMQRETALARLEAFDLNDRSSYQNLQGRVPAAARLATQVENVLRQQRAAGIYSFSREQIFKYLLGEEMMNRATQTSGRQRQQGAASVRRQTVRPSGGNRGDVATGSNRARGDDADRRLLESININDVM